MTVNNLSAREERQTQAHKFVTRLLAYEPDKASQDRRALAELRGLLHDQPRDYLRAGKYVFPYLPAPSPTRPGEDEFVEQCFFQIGALYAWGQGGIAYRKSVSLGTALRKLRQSASGNDSLDGRFLAMLNSAPETFFHHLRQLISLLRSATRKEGRAELDWEMLLLHTLDWSQDNKRVQRLWARHFYRDPIGSALPSETNAVVDEADDDGHDETEA